MSPLGSEYISPEDIRSGELSMKSDIYSFGVIILQIVSGQILKNSSIRAQQADEPLQSVSGSIYIDGA